MSLDYYPFSRVCTEKMEETRYSVQQQIISNNTPKNGTCINNLEIINCESAYYNYVSIELISGNNNKNLSSFLKFKRSALLDLTIDLENTLQNYKENLNSNTSKLSIQFRPIRVHFKEITSSNIITIICRNSHFLQSSKKYLKKLLKTTDDSLFRWTLYEALELPNEDACLYPENYSFNILKQYIHKKHLLFNKVLFREKTKDSSFKRIGTNLYFYTFNTIDNGDLIDLNISDYLSNYTIHSDKVYNGLIRVFSINPKFNKRMIEISPIFKNHFDNYFKKETLSKFETISHILLWLYCFKNIDKENKLFQIYISRLQEGTNICVKNIKNITNKIWVNLNEDQRKSIIYSLNPKLEMMAIHGPPGTGKTTTILSIIIYHLLCNKRILVTAPSNSAVDHILYNLHDIIKDTHFAFKIIRLGHPVKVNPLYYNDLEQYLLEFLLYSKCQSLTDNISKIENISKPVVEKTLSNFIVNNRAQIVVGTTCSVANYYKKNLQQFEGYFDIGIVDESAQNIECEEYYVTVLAKKVIIAGDHRQLPPTIKHPGLSVNSQLSTSLFERLLGPSNNLTKSSPLIPNILLHTQYRMNEGILLWSNIELYNGQLKSHINNRNSTLFTQPRNDIFKHQVLWIDTSYTKDCLDSKNSKLVKSKCNIGECRILIKILELLNREIISSKQYSPPSIAVISPYLGQINLLKNSLPSHLQSIVTGIDSIDAFQGSESDVVIVSLVRSNRQYEIGFLQELRRLNVSFTRARKLLIIIGNGTLFSHEYRAHKAGKHGYSKCPALGRLYDYMRDFKLPDEWKSCLLEKYGNIKDMNQYLTSIKNRFKLINPMIL